MTELFDVFVLVLERSFSGTQELAAAFAAWLVLSLVLLPVWGTIALFAWVLYHATIALLLVASEGWNRLFK